MADTRHRAEPRPPILSRIDALDFAAMRLERMAAEMEIAKILMETVKLSELNGENRESFEDLKRSSIEPDIQAKAMRDGAAAIRQLSIEERVVAARVAAGAGIRRG